MPKYRVKVPGQQSLIEVDIPLATPTSDGLMSAQDKAKLDSLGTEPEPIPPDPQPEPPTDDWEYEGLKRPAADITATPSGVQKTSVYVWNPSRDNLTLDMRNTEYWANYSDSPANKQKYPVTVNAKSRSGLYICGGIIRGKTAESMNYDDNKKNWDGNGITFNGVGRGNNIPPGGALTLEGTAFINCHDAMQPKENVKYFAMHHCYVLGNRDDMCENDQAGVGTPPAQSCQSGEFINCLVDGTFAFLAARPGQDGGSSGCNGNNSPAGLLVKIFDSVIGIGRMPFDTAPNGEPNNDHTGDGKGGGGLFKWSRCGGKVHVRNTILMQPNVHAIGGESGIGFPAPNNQGPNEGGTYENVTLVWGGPGSYPAAVPPGVTVTKDRAVFENARRAWLDKHPQFSAIAPTSYAYW